MQRLTFNLGHTFCAELTEQVLHVFKFCNVMFGIFAFSLAYFLKHWLWNWNFDTCYVSIYSLSYILASNMTYDICILWNYYYSQSNQHLHWLILCVVITFSLPIRLIYYRVITWSYWAVRELSRPHLSCFPQALQPLATITPFFHILSTREPLLHSLVLWLKFVPDRFTYAAQVIEYWL